MSTITREQAQKIIEAADEFVASLKVLREAGILAGTCCHCDATISSRAEHPS
ncbi:hypothetical protein OLZ31_02510 [Enterobacter asburiae]|nr:hypothetical protein [Enterobacter asburiae]